MATKNLNELRDKLYVAFDKAIERSANWESNNAHIEAAKSAAEIAKAIVAVETRLDERQGSIKLPGKA